MLVNLFHDSLTGHTADLNEGFRRERAAELFVMGLDILRIQHFELFLLLAVIISHFFEMIGDPRQSFQTANARDRVGKAVERVFDRAKLYLFFALPPLEDLGLLLEAEGDE